VGSLGPVDDLKYVRLDKGGRTGGVSATTALALTLLTLVPRRVQPVGHRQDVREGKPSLCGRYEAVGRAFVAA